MSTKVFDELNEAAKVEIKIKNAGLRDEIIKTLVEEELKSRAAKLVQASRKFAELKREHEKLSEPDSVTHIQVEGVITKQLAFSDATFKRIRKSEEKLTKFANAFNIALNEGNFDSLNKLLSGEEKQVSAEESA